MRTSLRAAVAFSILLSVTGCTCNGPLIQEKIGRRPALRLSIDGYLQETRNPPLTRFSRAIGFLTTPFKNLGVVGWIDLNSQAEVIGCVEQDAISTDRFQTLDVRVVSFKLAGEVTTKPLYIRVEVCRADLPSPPPHPMPQDRQVMITGELMWDGDGFFEIHPGRSGSVVVLENRQCPPPG